MATASDLETYMLELVNETRSENGLDPLSIDPTLNDAAEYHAEWMLETDTFAHEGADGSTSTDRIRDAGYALEGDWSTGENVAWQSERGEPGLVDDVEALHAALMKSPGHRANILSDTFDEIGIGIETGDFTAETGTYDSVMVAQSFARSDASDGEEPVSNGATEAPNAEADAGADETSTDLSIPDALSIADWIADVRDYFVFASEPASPSDKEIAPPASADPELVDNVPGESENSATESPVADLSLTDMIGGDIFDFI
ncbi:Cysteine-rich secretory protein family protein [Palleronia aestuarii]|uniref:Cysteine-rich secretory protein family protein n=1 Tax=Palleronia aestuarii TaxID=568105 RepID=A0A2W7NFV9_9RHOB|nr:CAP domain-containing protein [Palleronia aestuarii]PZX18800.1 Cysteine-rich secretory protein family protein [Palleronia aestuarii]